MEVNSGDCAAVDIREGKQVLELGVTGGERLDCVCVRLLAGVIIGVLQDLARSRGRCVIDFAIIRLLSVWLSVEIQGERTSTREKCACSGAEELIKKETLRTAGGL